MARTPPMGWNSYNKFAGNVTEAQVKAIADAFVSEGLQAAGFQYIVVDYCWMQSRNSAGQMVPSGSKFPGGMKALGDYIHAKGLKFGMYQSPTKVTCCGESGSYQHETTDAATFASWGVDYLKYDWCGSQSGENGKVTGTDVMGRYMSMRDAIKASGRPMVFAMCEKGQGYKVQPATWSEPVGHMWRIGNDIAATWARVLTSFDIDLNLGQYAKPGGWNDPDMLEVGNGSLTDAENRSHLSLWSIVAAPLMLGNDPSKMSASVKSILTNTEVIAIDQDPLGKQGKRVSMSGQTEVWSRPMQDGSTAVVMFNRGGGSASVTANWSDIGVSGSSQVRDLWAHADKGAFASSYSAMVGSHDVSVIRVYPPGVSPDAGVVARPDGGIDAAATGGSTGGGGVSGGSGGGGAGATTADGAAGSGGPSAGSGGTVGTIGSGGANGSGGFNGTVASGGSSVATGGALGASGGAPGSVGPSGTGGAITTGVDGGSPTGCGCRVGANTGTGGAAGSLFVVAVLAWIRAGRRRRGWSPRRPGPDA